MLFFKILNLPTAIYFSRSAELDNKDLGVMDHLQLPFWVHKVISWPAAVCIVFPVVSDEYCQWPIPAYQP